jgi:hypothetical protein
MVIANAPLAMELGTEPIRLGQNMSRLLPTDRGQGVIPPEQLGQARGRADDRALGRGQGQHLFKHLAAATIVIHQGCGERISLAIAQQDGSGRAINGNTPDRLSVLGR